MLSPSHLFLTAAERQPIKPDFVNIHIFMIKLEMHCLRVVVPNNSLCATRGVHAINVI